MSELEIQIVSRETQEKHVGKIYFHFSLKKRNPVDSMYASYDMLDIKAKFNVQITYALLNKIYVSIALCFHFHPCF